MTADFERVVTRLLSKIQAVIVELMTSGHTPESLTLWVAERHKEAGLHPVIALKESTGFIFNRIWAAIKREVMNVLAEGVATPATIDSIWVEMYGSKVGPCAMMGWVSMFFDQDDVLTGLQWASATVPHL